MFFVVDVETSGLTPWTGQLQTVAIVPVCEDGTILQDNLYLRLMSPARDPRVIPEQSRTDTINFWLEQDDSLIDETFVNYPRHHIVDAQQYIKDFAEQIEPDKSKRFIAANPVAFDKMWLEFLYNVNYNLYWPFHYRCLCLRSMRFGMELDEVEFGSRSGAHQSKIPHHALEDALAEAADLSFLIKTKKVMLNDFETAINYFPTDRD